LTEAVRIVAHVTREVQVSAGRVHDIGYHIMLDHVHLSIKAHRSDSPSWTANQFKEFTPRRLRAEFPHLRSRLRTLWFRSHFAATVGTRSSETVRQYIDTQNERPRSRERDR